MKQGRKEQAMRYEIIKIDGVYCIFKGERIISAYETLKQAKEAVQRYKAK